MNEVVKRYLSLFVNDHDSLNAFSQKDIEFIEFCLLHKEERNNTIRDQWGNWDFPYTNSSFSKPFLDEFVIQILKKNQIKQKSIWPKNKKFGLSISHDVDFVSLSGKHSAFRRFSKEPFSTKSLLKLLYHFGKQNINLFTKNNDPLWCYEKWIEELKKYNYLSTFFYFSRPEGRCLHVHDCDYLFSDIVKYDGKRMSVAEMMIAMEKNGFEIGLHGSYHTCNNSTLLSDQKVKLEKILNRPVTSTRQHWLHFDIHMTPEIQRDAGVKVDSTLGFNRNIGFRAGTCFPYYLTDRKLNKIDLLEIPMNIMDGALFTANALELNEEYAIKKSLQIMDMVERVGGCLTINFHPNYLIYPMWWNTFKAILKEAHSRGAHCVKMNEFESIVDANMI